ncbi:M20/M25/M40 family metallo-hydrolase [Aestuariivirga sp.]|jgi:acetylornithine deacetylase/succinyl-diaminopimelate desuccinylase-like protein|uniref:M20/M25/M40 family metallo-hydrolase n=1 Tax=Aestuariivirga sp. TaxID=2650926 RepID=UPI0037850FBF
MTDLNAVLAAAAADFDNSLERLFRLVRIPSVSTDPAHAADCETAAKAIVADLKQLGFKAEARKTKGRPMVVAHYTPKQARPGTPHFLFYGHYDVQPADPLELWATPPFEPVVKTEKGVARMYGRGTADDKGQFMTFVEAARAWIKATGSLPVKATFLIEGEEESGSPSLVPFLKAHAKELSCDAAFVCDTNMWDRRTPAITTRLRGLVHEEVTITGPRIDLHSGVYGGPAMSPIRVLSKVIAALHDKTGRVTIPGFYDGVAELPKATRKQWQSLDFSEARFLREVGLKLPAGEKGRSVLEQVWARPTAEVNGVWGGYTGAGTKTVLPSQAHAKFTFRLVGRQKPEKVLKAFQRFVKGLIPKDCKVTFSGRGGGSPATEIAEDNPIIAKSAKALKDEFRREAVLMGSGGSIPICRSFKDILGMDSILVGFGQNDDAIHSPNEKYDVESFRRGIRSWVRIMGEFGA